MVSIDKDSTNVPGDFLDIVATKAVDLKELGPKDYSLTRPIRGYN